ncbi:MAG: Rid family detoxifying hydrolase [Chloroflexota bacterium]|nr:Rid family detoxifying hydrolase [Chloroflexota bacterium]
MSRQVVSTEGAPAAVGPYSQGIITGNLLFTAGQTALVPGTRSLAEGGIDGQTRQVLKNLKAIIEAAGSSLDRVVKTTVYLADMNDFAAMNVIYATYFPNDPPARTTIQAAKLPLNAIVEIEAIAQV